MFNSNSRPKEDSHVSPSVTHPALDRGSISSAHTFRLSQSNAWSVLCRTLNVGCCWSASSTTLWELLYVFDGPSTTLPCPVATLQPCLLFERLLAMASQYYACSFPGFVLPSLSLSRRCCVFALCSLTTWRNLGWFCLGIALLEHWRGGTGNLNVRSIAAIEPTESAPGPPTQTAVCAALSPGVSLEDLWGGVSGECRTLAG